VIIPILIGVGLALLISSTQQNSTDRALIAPVPGIDVRGNARQVREGYTLSGMIAAENVPNIRRRGIRVVLSAVDPGEPARAALAHAGIEWVPVPLGSTWRHTATLARVASRYRPEEILIHCTHGVDRTGNIAAHYLVTRHGWTVPDALYAVVNQTEEDLLGLGIVLQQYGYTDHRRTRYNDGVGIYALRPIGRSGGMKARNEAYRRLISGNIEAVGGE